MTLDGVKEVIDETLKYSGDVTTDTKLKGDLIMDSLDGVELVMALEEKFGVEIPNEDMANLETVGDIVTYIDKKAQKG
ncbi:acyl carrier protein [Porcincola intestinalis]|uniref:Acyl carrier protein n=1 Tax=Porcincola intestinalis TaxID=2606632 RepID=A0A6L5X3Q8_9FIRM|nr:acyl carrier protein [Porcincola intestinalis]MCI6238153.1 acyl carrier protein [Lachnospiraceae bacterium]MCI6698188.1 acyl carrier protein [Lachnospiraceae bacterium]MCI7093779.1 acyl carrier protein [Lachnospiraceae bacterium]MDD7059349.1 acyl carrier protein [Porcincola intestinalis]MDY4205820.1 acyl carrier protein [Porcincola intestinalis]